MDKDPEDKQPKELEQHQRGEELTEPKRHWKAEH